MKNTTFVSFALPKSLKAFLRAGGVVGAALFVLLAAAPAAFSQAACATGQVLINEIYSEGGMPGATYTNDFVELYNVGGGACNLTNYSIQVASGNANNFPNVFAFPNGSVIPSAGFFLIRFGSSGANGAALPAADFTAATNLSTDGKVALVNNPASLTGNCASNLLNSIDFVGYGTTNCFLGAGPAQINTVTNSAQRTYNGYNTNNNANDFIIAPVTPRNTLSPTAAAVNVTGRVTAFGKPVGAARVSMTDPNGQTQTTRTNSFGYYTFADVPAGATYLFAVTAKGYTFTPQIVGVTDELAGLDFEADAPIYFRSRF